VYLLGSSREEAFRDLRTALHESSSPAVKAQVQTAVQTAFRLSQKQGQFGVLVELAGFYGAEFGDQLAGDPFREEFRRALEASAGRFGAGERMKAVFVQALLASAFAGEETGRKAQRETVRRAFEAVASVTPDKDFGAPGPPSGIPGHSTVGVNNSTEHHILLVYDGPEQFAVLCSPLRKGSFTARNGAYRIAVMTPLGDIVPYRAERTLKDEHAMSDYRIQKGGPGADASWNYGATAYGDYTLLRAGDGLGAMLVNPQTGTIKAQ
jgi:hypothetical protein